MKKVLFVASNSVHKRALDYIKDTEIHYLNLIQSPRYNTKRVDIENYLVDARRIIHDQKIDGVYTDSDLGSIIQAILCEEFGIPGPSLNSVFICYNKFYSRKLVAPEIKFKSINLDEPQSEFSDFPVYLKAPYSAYGTLGYTFKNQEEFDNRFSWLAEENRQMADPLRPVFDKYLDSNKFPEAAANLMIAEEVILDNQITIEGYVHNGKVRPLLIVDTNFFEGTHIIDNFCVPSVLSEAVQEKIRRRCIKDINKSGLDNCFFNIEYWVNENRIRLIEINARSATCFFWLYRHTVGFDVFKAGLELCLGQEPNINLSDIKTGGQFNIITQKSGRASDIMDYSLLKDFPYRFYMTKKEDAEIKHYSEHGCVLLQMEILGRSYEGIKQKADEQRRRLLKQKPF